MNFFRSYTHCVFELVFVSICMCIYAYIRVYHSNPTHVCRFRCGILRCCRRRWSLSQCVRSSLCVSDCSHWDWEVPTPLPSTVTVEGQGQEQWQVRQRWCGRRHKLRHRVGICAIVRDKGKVLVVEWSQMHSTSIGPTCPGKLLKVDIK
jgi:hypothetical protein